MTSRRAKTQNQLAFIYFCDYQELLDRKRLSQNRTELQMTCCEKLDKAFFPYDFSKINSQGYFFKPKAYTLYRGCMAFLAVILFILLKLYDPTMTGYAYLTDWGFTATTFFFVVAFVQNVLQRNYGKDLRLKVWKVTHFSFADIFVLEIMINIVFWCILVPFIALDPKSGIQLKPLNIIYHIGAHLVPLIFLSIDMANNLVCYWDWKHFAVLTSVLIVYLGLNAGYTLTIRNIYPPLTYTDWITYAFIVGVVLLAAGSYWIAVGLTRCKREKVIKMLQQAESVGQGSDVMGGEVGQYEMTKEPQKSTEMNTIV